MTYAGDKVKQRFFQQPKGRYSKIHYPIWPNFGLVRYFIPVHLICKFHEHQINNKWVTLMTKSNRSFFSNQDDVTLWLMIRSGQFSNLTELSSMSTLSASFRNIWSKLKELWWWQILSHCKSMEPCGCHSNKGFLWNSMKNLCHQSPPEAFYRWEMIKISPQTVEI